MRSPPIPINALCVSVVGESWWQDNSLSYAILFLYNPLSLKD